MQQIEPYKVTNATLLTYSGKTVKVTLESEIFTEPIRKVKDRILDAFTSMCKNSKDPFVRKKILKSNQYSRNHVVRKEIH